MKLIAKILLLVSLAATLSLAQTVNHVIVVIQENRTPDNLFGSDLYNQTRRLPNAHLAPNGMGVCWDPVNKKDNSITLGKCPLDSDFDPDHQHPGWVTDWDHVPGQGTMDGFCNNGPLPTKCTNVPTCNGQPCPQYTYVDNTPLSNGYGIVEPYYRIGIHYGFANYMFQTSQGPSFAAHQFLFSGTSAPDQDPVTYFDWFTAENPRLNGVGGLAGCAAAPPGSIALELDPTVGDPEQPGYAPPEPAPFGSDAGYPCYDHPTLATLLDNYKISWKYYAPQDAGPPGSDIWTAPNAIHDICYPIVNGQCTGTDWTANVVIPPVHGYSEPILWDLGDNNQNYCGLPAVSWVAPDGNWSDHPGSPGETGGPSWVAALINGVGGLNNDLTPFPTQCYDVINGQKVPYWNDTVILVVWDDWGGFYDDVDPNPTGLHSGYSNNTGQQYVYGFRVPLLVVSAYAKPGYTSGPVNGATCPGNPYCHDFGSILNFIEHTFGIPNPPGINGNVYPYADSLAMDANCPTCAAYSLADFFDTPFHSFTPIKGWYYNTDCFTTNTANCFPAYPAPPDNDVIDND